MTDRLDPLLEVVTRVWGFAGFRPLQREAMQAALERRDSLVVLPTGGGKSLCYQAPALLSDKLTVVVSPLISLMKDQVDRLIAQGVPAAFLNSSLESGDRGRVQAGIARGAYKMLFVAPERFAAEGFGRILELTGVGAFAIDEAHCISHWGHDFREEYRALGRLKREFPDASVHAFTATATPRVRDDIVEQLGLKDPAVLVGDFFRPNLRFRVAPRSDAFRDVVTTIRSGAGGTGIVYCIRRADVDGLASQLQDEGIRAVPYHAGMDDEARTRAQDRFVTGDADVVVATVAFGMGIDRADVRFVIHAAMPQSLEHYQQEAGRAGRDGRPADCVLFYTGADFQLWRSVLEKQESADAESKFRLLSQMYRYCTGARCRHRTLVEYFGQAWKGGPCGACDVCGGGLGALPDASAVARKIISCIARTGQRYGPGHVADVLRGDATDRAIERGHDKVDEFGLLRGQGKGAIIGWIDQLADQELIRREGDYGVLKITAAGGKVLRSEAEARLYAGAAPPAARKRKKPAAPARPSVPVTLQRTEQALFEKLRALRRSIAEAESIPAYLVFSDRTLREMARAGPASEGALLDIHGVGPAKFAKYGRRFIDLIRSCLP